VPVRPWCPHHRLRMVVPTPNGADRQVAGPSRTFQVDPSPARPVTVKGPADESRGLRPISDAAIGSPARIDDWSWRPERGSNLSRSVRNT